MQRRLAPQRAPVALGNLFPAMPDFRAHCLPTEREPAEIRLSFEESHHLVIVNRAAKGDTVVAFDGRGSEWICELADDSRKATALGAARIVPLESERTQIHLDEARSDKKNEKWQTAALEAAKQCGNPWLPEIAPVQKVPVFMESARGYDLKLIASLQPGAKTLKSVLAAFQAAQGRSPKKVLWLIGPEGDFTPAEASLAKSTGFEPITLGPLVLRCETAAIYALSVLSHELQG
jgi:16S rRNA (uracil1498-N3)-methyltransferase